MRVTIKEVAQRAGVSAGTVSNVLNGRPGEYNQLTSTRVHEAVRALGYHPNRVARSLVQRESMALGVSFIDQGQSLGDNPYLANVLDGLVKAAREENYNIVLYIRPSLEDVDGYAANFLDGRIDGLFVIAPDLECPRMQQLAATDLPFIILGVENPLPDTNWMDVDNMLGAKLAMECLIDHGHIRIAHLAGCPGQKAALLRAKAYEEALCERGFTPNPRWLQWCGFEESEAREAAFKILQMQHRPTAIFAANDQIAFGAMEVARELGIRVPDELSIIGFDDIRESRRINPALTTIHHPMLEIGYDAAKSLIRILRGETSAYIQQLANPTLVMRKTVAPFHPKPSAV